MPSFRKKLMSGEAILGTWVKTPSPIICEVLALTDLDVICLDAEHAPFGRVELDQCIASSIRSDMPCLVRVPTADPSLILNALDCGATGIVAPHIRNPEDAIAFSKACKFGAGGRGYAGSSRAAGFTTISMAKNIENNKNETAVIAMIEDIEALKCLDEIASVEGIDCLFIGRIDLVAAYGADSPNDARVVEAVEKICEAGKRFGKSVGMFTPSIDEIPKWRLAGANFFLLGSEHNFILQGSKEMKKSFVEAWES